MENEELKKILNRLPIPEPSEEAKNRAVQSAMAEFRLQEEKNKNRVKGFTWLDRLISKKPKGGFFMNRTIAASTAGLAVSVLTFAIVFSPIIVSHIRRNIAPVASRKVQVHKKDYSSEPAESTTSTQPAGEKGKPLQTAKEDSTLLTQREQVKTLKTPAADAPPDVIIPESETSMVRMAHMSSGDSSDGNITESVKIGLADNPRPELLSGALKIDQSSDTTESGTADGKNEFAQEEITSVLPRASLMSLEKESAESKARAGSASEAEAARVLSAYISANPQPEKDRVFRDPQYIGRDRFEDIKANPVKLVSEEPVSTFSVDVDTSSYAFVRRALNSGYLPQADSVRIEELINYFDYDYPLPKDKAEPFKPTVTLFQTPWNANTKLLHIGIKGYDIIPENKPKANLTFLIDVSGSMQSEDKLPLLKNSLRMLVDTLNQEDTVAIAVYAGAAGTVLERTNASEKSKILAAIDKLQAGGSTAGGEGIKLAYSLAEADMDPKALNRVILATDGDFNVGITDKDVLQDFVERKRKTGIYLSVLGFGQGNYNDELMQKLAQNGNGNAAYIDNLNEARKVLVDEASGTLFTIAKDVKIQVEFNPNMVSEYRLIGYETRHLNREDFKNDNVDAGDIGSGHSVTAIYEITPKGSEAQLIDDLRYGSKDVTENSKTKGNSSEYAFLKIRYKLPDEDSSREISTPIDKGNEYKSISEAPADSRFASAVGAFGQLLRGDSYINQFTYDDVITLAKGAVKDDSFGYRTEFINLVRLAKTASAMGNR